MLACPICRSSQTVKTAGIHNGKQRFKCHKCERQFVEHPQKKVVDPATQELIDRLVRKTLSNSYVFRESYWCHLIFHRSLQRVITCVTLPNLEFLSDDSILKTAYSA